PNQAPLRLRRSHSLRRRGPRARHQRGGAAAALPRGPLRDAPGRASATGWERRALSIVLLSGNDSRAKVGRSRISAKAGRHDDDDTRERTSMRRSRTFRLLGWALVGAVAGALAVAGPGVFVARAADPIKIGLGMALTGGLSANGKPALMAIQIWKDDV